MSGVNVLLFTETVMKDLYMKSPGAYRLATEVRKYGYTCQVIDFYTYFNLEEYEKLIDKFVGDETLVVGFSITYLQSLEKNINEKNFLVYNHLQKNYCGFSLIFFLNIISLFKKKNIKIKFVIGGGETLPTISYNIDVIKGYADQTFLEYIKKHDTKKIGKYNGEKFDFNRSQILWQPDDHVFEGEVLPIEISRGCVFNCQFCQNSNLNYIEKDPEILREEFERNYELYNINKYILCESTLNTTTKKLEKLYKEVFNKLNFKLEMTTFARLDKIKKNINQLELLKNMGVLYLNCGIETINEKTQNYLNKKLTINEIIEILQFINEEFNDIKIYGYFIFGLPYETLETTNYMQKWLVDVASNYFDGIITNCLSFNKLGNLFFEKEKFNYIVTPKSNSWKCNELTSKYCYELSENTNTILSQKNKYNTGFVTLTKKVLKHKNNINEIIKNYKENIIK